MKSYLLDNEYIGYYFQLTNANKCSIINFVKKKKPIISNSVGALTQIDFFKYIHTNSCPEWTRICNTANCCDITVECYALLLLHILIKIVK